MTEEIGETSIELLTENVDTEGYQTIAEALVPNSYNYIYIFRLSVSLIGINSLKTSPK